MPRSLLLLASIATLVAGMNPTTGCLAADPPGLQLRWADEFNGDRINTQIWERLTRRDDFNNDQQYYLPQQAAVATVSDPANQSNADVLRITATDEPFGDRDYRSARLESRTENGFTAGYGRVEVRARIPTTKGVWPAIWLWPNRGAAWPTEGEIDIMEHRGSRPDEVVSTYHYNTVPDFSTQRYHTHTATDASGAPTIWPDAFHTYAVEWEPHELRFYVNGYNHFTVVDDSAPAGYKPDGGVGSSRQRHVIPSAEMNVILNTAVGGDYDGDPDGTTVWPQHFDIDYVRVYDWADDGPRLDNGGFENRDSGWTLNSAAAIADRGAGGGAAAQLTSGAVFTQQWWLPSSTNEFRVDYTAEPGAAVLGGTAAIDVSYFDDQGQFVGRTRDTIAAGDVANGELTTGFVTIAPSTATYARMALLGPASGEVWIDDIRLSALAPVPGDYNGDGAVDAADYSVWRDNLDAPAGTLPNDVDGGTIDGDQYATWVQQFGVTTATIVPEPATIASWTIALVACLSDRRAIVRP